jgi:hypothetical protein
MSEHYYLALLIPILVTAIFYFIKKHEFSWWEFFIPIGSVLIAIIISKVIIDTSSVKFTEYWGSSIVAVYEEEPYNYWQHQTCSYTTTDGKGHTTTHYYDCSHQVDVGPEWYAVTNIKEQFGITEKQHDELLKQFKTKKTTIDSRRNHDSNDRCTGSKGTKFEGKQVGDISYIYQTVWGGQDETRKAYVSQHTYVNKVKASDLTIFNISLVTEEQADSMKLFRYPEHKSGGWFSYTNGLDFPTILGGTPSEITQEKFKRLNGKFGVSNQVRLWVLIFENQPQSIARYQENYWVKGNMNELVLCIGTKNSQINWAHTFSWAYSNELTIDIRDEILNLYMYKDSTIKKQIAPPIARTIFRGRVTPAKPAQYADTTIKIKSPNYPVLTENTWNDLYQYLNNNLQKFQRRDFEEFNYLTVNPSTGAIIFIFIFAIIISLASNFWIINNEFWGEVKEINWKKITKKIKKLFRRNKSEDYE